MSKMKSVNILDLKLVLPDVMFKEIKEIIKNNNKSTMKVTCETVKTNLQNEVLIFSTFLDAQKSPAINGYKIMFPDGSIMCYLTMKGKEDAIFWSLNKKENVITKHSEKVISFSLKDVAKMADEQLKEHEKWMKEHFPNGEYGEN